MHGAEGGNAIFDFLNTSNEITPRSKSIHIHNEFQWFSNIMESVFIFWTPLMKYERRFSRLHKSTPPGVTHSVTSNKTSNIPLEGLRKPFLALWPRARAIKKCERQRGQELQNWFSRHLQRGKPISGWQESAWLKKTCLWRLGGSDNVLQNQERVKTMKIVRGSPCESHGVY